jgi:transposase
MEKSPVPDPVIQHSFASPSSVAWVMYQKFVNALPLYRQEKEWKALGVSLSRATMANWIIAASRDWLVPIVERMHQILLKEKYLHSDETPVQVLNEEGRKNTTDSYMWVYSTGQHCSHQIRIFDYRTGRSGKYPQERLDPLSLENIHLKHFLYLKLLCFRAAALDMGPLVSMFHRASQGQLQLTLCGPLPKAG